MGLYAVQNDKGEWLSFYASHKSVWYTNNPTLFKDKSYAEAQAWPYAHVVELGEQPAPIVVPEWFDEWLDAFSDANPRVRAVAPAGRIAQEGWGTTADDPFITANIDNVETPRLTREQSDYLYSHKQELMIAALTGNYTVEKPKRYQIFKKLPGKLRSGSSELMQAGRVGDGVAWHFTSRNSLRQYSEYLFSDAEIEHYGLQDCEKVEVTDDGKN